MFGAYLIEKKQQRKRIVILFAGLARGMWIPVVALSVLLSQNHTSDLLKLLIVFILGSQILGAIGGVSWLSWMAGLVPDEIRGRFFGLRNSILGGVAVAIILLGGRFLDWFPQHYPGLPRTRAFEILFMLAIVAGAISLWFLSRKPELPAAPGPRQKLAELYGAPLHHQNFRRFLRFAMLRAFATNIAAPFFVVYLLKDLHFSYTVVGIFTILSALADLTGMWIWGHLSDHFGNRPIIISATMVTTILPAIWVFTSTGEFSAYFLIPMLHITGGFFWAGYNLCAANLVYRMAPSRGNAAFFASWSISIGVAAGLGALTGGLMTKNVDWLMESVFVTLDSGYKFIFLFSALLRVFPLLLARSIREEQGIPLRHAVRVLRNVRTWPTMMGFNHVLHFFLPATGNQNKSSLYWPIWQSQRSGESR